MQLRDEQDEFRSLGARLAVVGSGTPEQAGALIQREGLEFPVLSDLRMEAYRAAGLKRSVASSIGPRTLGRFLGAVRRGLRSGRLQGDPWQLGGGLVILPEDRVVFRQVSRWNGDHASLDDMKQALSTT